MSSAARWQMDAAFLNEGARALAQVLMELAVMQEVGAERYERRSATGECHGSDFIDKTGSTATVWSQAHPNAAYLLHGPL
jgi:hypothetical protein